MKSKKETITRIQHRDHNFQKPIIKKQIEPKKKTENQNRKNKTIHFGFKPY